MARDSMITKRNAECDLRLTADGVTDIGLQKEVNEDFFLLNPDRGLLAVFDGMGGRPAGEVASELAAVYLRNALDKYEECLHSSDPTKALDGLGLAVEHTNRMVFETARTNVSLRGMGTTATVLIVRSDAVGLLAHVGDSRLYRIRQQNVEQLTRDHTLANELIAEGNEIENDIAYLQFRRMLTKSLGTHEDITPDLGQIQIHSGDRFVLCSDGLSNYLSDNAMFRLAERNCDTASHAKKLIRFAKRSGGADNITVVVAEINPPA